MDLDGRVYTIKSEDIKFEYRKTNLPKNLILLAHPLKLKKRRIEIKDYVNKLKEKKEISQPLKVKTGGSTFKNPKDQTEKKVWELIKESVDNQISFGDAKISNKHSNFFINSKNASFENMNNLINYVKKKVKDKTGISLELELEIIN